MGKSHIIAYHGWGFPSYDWRPWEQLLPEEAELSLFDRGYFGPPSEPDFRDGCRRILLTHSYGLHLVPEGQFEKADLLVIISGFRSFHPEGRAGVRSRRVLRRMIRRFDKHPDRVLEEFYRNTWQPLSPPEKSPSSMNRELLAHDLARLGRSSRDPDLISRAGSVCMFHGAGDIIVPPERGRKLSRKLGKQCRFYVIEQGGHAIPFSHAKVCANLVRAEQEGNRGEPGNFQ